MCLNVVRTAFELNNHMHVGNYVAKAEAMPEATVSTMDCGGAATQDTASPASAAQRAQHGHRQVHGGQ